MENNAIYSTMVRAGRTTYFIDVKEAVKGHDIPHFEGQSIPHPKVG